MELSEFTLRIILLFIPGVISFIIIDKLTIHKESKAHNILIISLILGFICYIFYYLGISLAGRFWEINRKCLFFDALSNKEVKLDYKEIAVVSGLSIIIGFVFTFLINYKVLYRIAHRLKISNKPGDIDVWSYIMNSRAPEWVVIRDIENDLMYQGWIEAFSDGIDDDELFLRDVKVFRNSTAAELYEIPGLYLPRKRENIVVEFPLFGDTKSKRKIKGERGKK